MSAHTGVTVWNVDAWSCCQCGWSCRLLLIALSLVVAKSEAFVAFVRKPAWWIPCPHHIVCALVVELANEVFRLPMNIVAVNYESISHI